MKEIGCKTAEALQIRKDMTALSNITDPGKAKAAIACLLRAYVDSGNDKLMRAGAALNAHRGYLRDGFNAWIRAFSPPGAALEQRVGV